MNEERDQNIYELMSKQRLEIAAVQIDILTHYDPEGKEIRVQELYDVSHQSLIETQSELSIEEMDDLIRKYQSEISHYREEKPEVEESRDVRKKIGELERLSHSCGL